MTSNMSCDNILANLDGFFDEVCIKGIALLGPLIVILRLIFWSNMVFIIIYTHPAALGFIYL